MKQGERILVEALKRGEEKAFRYLYDHHYAVLCKLANGFLHDPFWAETIVGDTFFHLWEIRENLEITTSLRSYLVQAVRNRCLNQLAQEMDKKEMSFSELPLETLDASLIFQADTIYPLGVLLEKELEQEISKAIDEMPEESQIVFKKSRFELKKNEEIAQELGISVNTVKYHIKRALSFLRERLRGYLPSLLLLFFMFWKK